MKENENNDLSIHFERYNSLIAKYGKEKVYDCIEKLSPQNREIMCLYFGIGGEKLSVKEISLKSNRETYNVHYHLSFCMNKIDELLGEKKKVSVVVDRKEEFFDKYKNYSLEEINNAFDKMEGLGKEVILSYYGIGRECLRPVDISYKYDIKYHTVYNYLKNGLKIFERHLNNKRNEKEIVYAPQYFYAKFKGFSKEEIDECVLGLNSKIQDILNYFYGLKGDSFTASEIAEKYSVDISMIHEIVDNAILKISKILKKEKKEEERKKEFYSMFEGCSEEQVNQALTNLDKRRQDIFKSYYGLGCCVLTMDAIGKKYDLTRSRINQIMKADLDKLKELLKSPEDKKREMQEEFYKSFDGYSKEEIDSALLDLKKRDMEIIRYYYGFEDELLDIHQLASKYYLGYSSVSGLIKRKMEVISNILKDPSLKRSISKKGFYKRFENYSKEEVDKAFNKLEYYDKRILSLYYGLGMECLTMKEIASRFYMDESHVYYYIDSRMKKIEKFLISPDANKGSNKEEFYNLFRGFSAKQIREGMMGLNVKSFDIIVMYYGLKGESKGVEYIAKKYHSYKSIISETLNKNIILIKKGILKNMNQRFLVDVDCTDIIAVKKAMRDLNERDLKLISLYYGLNGVDVMSRLEISEKFNVSEDIVDKKICELIEIIKQNLAINKR